MNPNDIAQFAHQHQGAVEFATMWAVREAHIWWPELKKIYPEVKAQGGVWLIIKLFFYSPSTSPATATVQPLPLTNQPQNGPK